MIIIGVYKLLLLQGITYINQVIIILRGGLTQQIVISYILIYLFIQRKSNP